MSYVSFKFTVIKGKIKTGEEGRPSCFVIASIDDEEVLRTQTAERTKHPKWNQTFRIANTSAGSSMCIFLRQATSPTDSVLLGKCVMSLSEISTVVNRFNFGFMSRVELKLTPNVENSNRLSKYKLYIGLSKEPLPVIEIDPESRQSSNYLHSAGTSSFLSQEPNVSTITYLNPSMLTNLSYTVLEENPGELPYGWERRASVSNTEYYIDHNTQTTYFERPQSLPPGWEARRINDLDRIYYYNTNDRTTSWQRPTAENISRYRSFIDSWIRRRATNRPSFNARCAYENTDNIISDKEITDKKLLARVIESLLGPLPDNYEIRIDKTTNRKFFVDHNAKECSWNDPRLFWLNSEINPLPKGWTMRYNSLGIPVFVDLTKKTTTFYDPRNGVSIFPVAAIAMKNKHCFRDKIIYFRHLCKEFTQHGTVKIAISRNRFLEDSFAAVMNYSPNKLHKTLMIKFENEVGLDYGGITREWLYEISHDILNPQYCLFMTRSSSSDYLFDINPFSNIVPDYLKYFNFVGRIIGLALFHAKFLDCAFSALLYKKILNQPCILDDLQHADFDFYNSIKWLSKNNIKEAGLDLFFCSEIETFGELKIIELKPDGAEIQVNEKNKEEYIKLMVDWKLNYGKKDQMDQIILGISQIVPLTWLRSFSVKEFELLLCGIPNYDVEDWKKYSRYKGGYNQRSPQVIWFWEFVKNQNAEYRGKLIHFVTGTTRIPPTGFKDLIGSNGPQLFCLEKWGNVKDLPRAHTCFNRLDLPPYSSYETLKCKLTLALEEGNEGFYQE